MKILFITGSYPPNVSQNGFIVSNIVNVLLKQNNDVVCLTKDYRNSSNNSCHVYRIKTNYWDIIAEKISCNEHQAYEKYIYNILIYVRKVWLGFYCGSFPNNEPKTTKRMINKAIELHTMYQFDCVIGTFRPYSTISTVITLKRKFPDLICGAYFLDLIESIDKPSFMPAYLFKKLIHKNNIIAFSILDFILLPKNSKKNYNNSVYFRFINKLYYIDYPAFVVFPEFIKTNKLDVKDNYNFVFTGTLSQLFRNPLYLLKTLDRVAERGFSLTIDFYGKGDCKDIIEKYSVTSSSEIVHHGLVSKKEADEKLIQADFLINISNDYENIVPSKIFELFATGKPIINFVSKENDMSYEYFERYPLQFTIKGWESIDTQVVKLQKFIQNSFNKTCDFKTLKITYWENTPEYVASFIHKIILNLMRN